jgi:S-(hydroxymethyl)glutathione dehydrogenase/alcohol dehydrogenase
MAGADKIIGIDINPGREAMAREFGLTDFINPRDIGADKVVQAIVDLTGGGVEYSFDCTGNVQVMRQALECCHRGWGESIIIGIVDWYMEKKIAIDPLITHVLPLEQINDAFDLMHEGKSIRTVVVF